MDSLNTTQQSLAAMQQHQPAAATATAHLDPPGATQDKDHQFRATPVSGRLLSCLRGSRVQGVVVVVVVLVPEQSQYVQYVCPWRFGAGQTRALSL